MGLIWPPDETVDVVLALRTSSLDETALRNELSRLVISLEVQVSSNNAQGRDTPPSSDTIFSEIVPDVGNAVVFPDSETGAEDGSGLGLLALWKLSVFLARPRMRLHRPCVVFSATANLKPVVSVELNTKSNGYLQSGQPSGLNLLESFSSDLS